LQGLCVLVGDQGQQAIERAWQLQGLRQIDSLLNLAWVRLIQKPSRYFGGPGYFRRTRLFTPFLQGLLKGSEQDSLGGHIVREAPSAPHENLFSVIGRAVPHNRMHKLFSAQIGRTFLDLPEEELGGGEIGSTRADIGEEALLTVRPIGCHNTFGGDRIAEVIAKGHTKNMDQMSVLRGRGGSCREQRLDLCRVRMVAQSAGSGANHERV